jgi:hypothetical protein
MKIHTWITREREREREREEKQNIKIQQTKWNESERGKKNPSSSTSKFDASCTLTILTKSSKKNGGVLLSSRN